MLSRGHIARKRFIDLRKMRSFSLIALLAAACSISHAHANGVALPAIVSGQVAPESRGLGGSVSLMVPVVLDKGIVAFGHGHLAAGGNGSAAGSIGLGLRRDLGNGAVIGGHVHLDGGFTALGNTYHQLSAGLELLSDAWEFRLNGYLPVGRTESPVDTASSVWAEGGRLLMKQGYEVALYGLDAEAGIRLPVFAEDSGQSLKIFAGAFSYGSTLTGPVSGISARAEWQLADFSAALPGASLTLGASARYDSDNRFNAGLFARLSAPIGGPAPKSAAQDLLTAPVGRRSGIVTTIGAHGAVQQALLANGRSYSIVGSVSAATGDMAAINAGLARLGDGALVLASGDIVVDRTLSLASNQLLVGGGGRLDVVGQHNGRAATFINPGSPTTLRGQGVDVVRLASGATVSQLAIAGGRNGIVADSVANVGVDRVAITGSGDNGIALNRVDGAAISGSRIADLFICENNTACEFSIFRPSYVPYAAINAVGTRNLSITDTVIANTTYGIFAASLIDDAPWPPVMVAPVENLVIRNVAITNARREGLLTAAADRVEIDRLTVDNSALRRNMDLVVFQNSTNIALRNSTLKGGVNALMLSFASVINDHLTGHVLVENVAISQTSRAGIFFNPSHDVTLRNVRIDDVGSYGLYFHGDPWGFAGGPIRDVVLDRVSIGKVADGAAYFSGPVENVTGAIAYTDTDPNCLANTDAWSGTALTQPAGAALRINGTLVTDANLASGCR